MAKTLLKVFLLLCLVIVIFVWIGYAITGLSGGKSGASIPTGINVESGEVIFWGKGKCYTCHTVGDRGSVIRCPNLGEKGEKFPLPIGLRAETRAKERSAKTGKRYTAADYLIESIVEPEAYVVEGYKKEMPKVYEPPLSLTPDEIKAVLIYLFSQRYEDLSDSDLKSIISPESKTGHDLLAKIETLANSERKFVAFKPYFKGDPNDGKKIFFDPKGNTPCGKCHKVNGKGGNVGPDLTSIAATRTVRFLIESIIDPSGVIANGYEPILVVTDDSRYIAGIKRGETEETITVAQADGEEITIYKDEIKMIAPQKKSLMPGDFREIMTMKQFHDILAYLQSLTGETLRYQQ